MQQHGEHRELTRQEAKEKTKEYYGGSIYIDTSEFPEDREERHMEVWSTVENQMSMAYTKKNDLYHIIRDLAYCLERDSLPRVKQEHLVFDSMEESVAHGYWPYNMDKWRANSALRKAKEPHENVWEEAQSEVELAIREMIRNNFTDDE